MVSATKKDRRGADGRPRQRGTNGYGKQPAPEIHRSRVRAGVRTEVFPFSFGEYLGARGIDLPERPVYGGEVRSRLAAAFGDFLVRGGFPEVQGEMPPSMRREILQEYVDVVILRDVVERHGVKNVPALRAVLRHLLQNPGGRFSVNRFMNYLRSEGIACGKNFMHDCLAHLGGAYLIYPVEIHSRSVRQRRVNPRKIYSIDTGLSQAFSRGITRDAGHLLESCVFMALRRRGAEIDYGLTGGGKEIDFIFEDGEGTHLLQACWSMAEKDTRDRELGALVRGLEEGHCSMATVVTAYEEELVDSAGYSIRVIPAWRWLIEQEGPSSDGKELKNA